MNGQKLALSFVWWNLHNFAHFESSKTAHPRWPDAQADYESKRSRVVAALRELFGPSVPDIFACCEITRAAALDLTTRLPINYELVLPTLTSTGDDFLVAVFYRKGLGISPELPVVPSEEEDLRAGVRQMIPVHFTLPGHLIRFVACHWTAFDNSSSRVARERLADVLKRDSSKFLRPSVPTPKIKRHLVIVGDLNDEPMSPIFRERLVGYRDHESSRSNPWQDEAINKVRLYNAAWRFLGQRDPHGGVEQPFQVAGTYYNDTSQVSDLRGWRTFDHLLVSSSLLTMTPPYLDEAETGVEFTALMNGGDGLPRPFNIANQRGSSDHLPIVGRIVLPGATK